MFTSLLFLFELENDTLDSPLELSPAPLGPQPISKKRKKMQIESVLEWDGVSALEHCGHRHLMFLTKEIMECRFTNEADKPWKSNPEIDNLLISFLENKQMNGSMVKEYDRKQFGKDAVAFCNEKKANGAAMKLYKRLMAMDNEQMERFKEKISPQFPEVCVCCVLQRHGHQEILEHFTKCLETSISSTVFTIFLDLEHFLGRFLAFFKFLSIFQGF